MVDRTQAFMHAHQSAYGTSHLKPKHHYALHNAIRAQSPGRLPLDCFVHERKHQILKRAASSIKNTSSFEASVLSRALLEQTRQLDALAADRCLVGDASPNAALALALGAAQAHVAKALRFDGLQLAVGDIVLGDQIAGEVRACCASKNGYCLLLQPLERMESASFSSVWRKAAGLVALELGDMGITLPYAWTPLADGRLRLLHR